MCVCIPGKKAMDPELEFLQCISELVERCPEYDFDEVYQYLKAVNDWKSELIHLKKNRPNGNRLSGRKRESRMVVDEDLRDVNAAPEPILVKLIPDLTNLSDSPSSVSFGSSNTSNLINSPDSFLLDSVPSESRRNEKVTASGPISIRTEVQHSPGRKKGRLMVSVAVSFAGENSADEKRGERGRNVIGGHRRNSTVTAFIDDLKQQQQSPADTIQNDVIVLDSSSPDIVCLGSPEKPIVLGIDRPMSTKAGNNAENELGTAVRPIIVEDTDLPDNGRTEKARTTGSEAAAAIAVKQEVPEVKIATPPPPPPQKVRCSSRIKQQKLEHKQVVMLTIKTDARPEDDGTEPKTEPKRGRQRKIVPKSPKFEESGKPTHTVPEISQAENDFVEMQGISKDAINQRPILKVTSLYSSDIFSTKRSDFLEERNGNKPKYFLENRGKMAGTVEEVYGFEPQPGPSGIRKRKPREPSEVTSTVAEAPSTALTPQCDNTFSIDCTKLMFIENGQIDYLTLEERKTLYTACQVVPTVDPSFVYDLITKRSMDGTETVIEYLFGHGYPTIKERVRREYMEKRRKVYLGEDGSAFNVAEYLTIYPEPEVFFEGKRQTNENYTKHAMAFLSREFKRYEIRFIEDVLKYNNGLLLPTYRALAEHFKQLRNSRGVPRFLPNVPNAVKFKQLCDKTELPAYPDIIDDVFFREVQYCLHEKQIKDYKAAQAVKREKDLQYAEANGLLKECIICCMDRYLPDDMIKCDKGNHEFCKNCLKQHTDTQIGEGMNWIRCMDDQCKDGRFEISSLQGIIPPTTFQLLVRRNQQEELRAANIGNIESCPFCDFAAVIENNEDRIFRCLNPICQKESCRNCREESHVPLRCEEVEKDFETKKRKFIEESMSEAVIRKCPKCGKRITKEDGCNKMTCPCGTFFCYVCNAALSKKNPYDHFSNKKGGCKQETPIRELHEMAAKRAGLEALRLFHEQNPETINSKTPDINELAGLTKKTNKRRRSVSRSLSPIPPPQLVPIRYGHAINYLHGVVFELSRHL